MHVKLILATGHHAGIEAPLQIGYYMLGRHGECQIRPKSHSVSRRHCLIHHAADHVAVFDLGSTNGTLVNDCPLELSEWRVLKDGDQLRCGKVAFDVSMVDEPAARSTRQDVDGGEPQPPIVRGNPWEAFEILAFLEREDEAERNSRYEAIRNHREQDEADGQHDEFHVLEETPDSGHAATSLHLGGEPKEGATAAEELADIDVAAPGAGLPGAAGDSGEEAGPSPRARRIAAIRKRIEEARVNQLPPTLSRNTQVVSGPLEAHHEPAIDVRLVAIAALVFISTGLLFFSTYRAIRSEPIRVLENID